MQTQSLLFDRSAGWTVEKAKEWAKQHGHKISKVDVTDRYIRLRQLDPKKFTVKRTVPFGKGIRAVVAREENMASKKKTTRRPAKRSASKKPPSPAQKAARARFAARFGGKKVASKTRRPKHKRVREAPKMVAAKRRPRRVRETSVVAEAKRSKKRKSAGRRKSHKAKPRSYVMAKAKRRTHKSRHRKVRAWFGDSAGHSKAAKKGWLGRKGHKKSAKPGKATKRASEARRRPKHRVRETMTVQARRRPKHRRVREVSRVAEARRRTYKRRTVRAPNFGNLARTALQMGLELGSGVAGYLVADGVDRFLATYDPAAAQKPNNKFTSDGTGTLANALNVASAPDLFRYGSLVALTALPLGGSLFVKHPALRSSARGVGLGAGIKLISTLWSNVLMPLLVGKDTSVPALQKSWVARLYPAEVSAALNMKSGTPAVSSGGKAGTLSDGPDTQTGVGSDVGLGRWGAPHAPLGHETRGWFGNRPARWRQTSVPPAPPDVAVDAMAPAAPGLLPWPANWGDRSRYCLTGVGEAVENIAATIRDKARVHPAHAINATMHVAAEPHDLVLALRRALPHLRHELLLECARHVHPHVVRMHAHARHPGEHAEWMHARSAEGHPAPEHDAPEHEWQEWHGKRAAAGLPASPPPPEPPPEAPTPVHLWERHDWHPKSDRGITFERYPTTQQALGIGAGGPATSGYPGQPGLGEAFANAVQSVAASIPEIPLENAVDTTAHAAAEPFHCERAIERALPLIRRELVSYCASQLSPHIRQLHEQAGVPIAPPEVVASPSAPVAVVPGAPVVEFVPSPPPPSWTRSEAEWHEEERRNWEHTHSGHPAVVAAATHAAEAAAAPHADANKPAVQAAVKAVADHAAQAASAAPPGTPAPAVHAAATQAAKAVAADAHPAVADHPAVQAAIKAGATAATAATEHPAAAVTAPPKTGVGLPPRHLQVGPPQLPHPQGVQQPESCGCLEDSPFLGFIGDEVEADLLFNMN